MEKPVSPEITKEPPEYLWHGTAERFLDSILPDAGDGIGQQRGNGSAPAPQAHVAGADLFAEEPADERHKGDGRQREQRQLPVQAAHDDKDADQREELHHRVLGDPQHEVLDHGGIAVDAVDDGAGGGLVVKAHGQVLGPGVDVLLHADDELVAGHAQQIGAQGGDGVLQHVHPQQRQDHGDQRLAVAAGQYRIHHIARHVGRDQGHGGGEDGQQHAHDQPLFEGLGVLGEFGDHLPLALAVQALRVRRGQLAPALGAEGALLEEGVFHRGQQLGSVLPGDHPVDEVRARVRHVGGGEGEADQLFPAALLQVHVKGGVAVHALDLGLSDLAVAHPQAAVLVGFVEGVHRVRGEAQGAFAVLLRQRQVAHHHEQRRLLRKDPVVLRLKARRER